MKKKNSAKKQVIIKEALLDLSKELYKLKSEKEKLSKDMEYVQDLLRKSQTKEINLKNNIAKIGAMEGKFSKRKSELQERMSSISEKITKISKIKEEMINLD